VDPNKPGVYCAASVNAFRNTLEPEEAELFNECLLRLLRNPRANRNQNKFTIPQPPLVHFMYRDRNFVLFYRWIQLTNPPTDWNYRVEVFRAARSGNFNQDKTLPWR